MFGKKTRIRLNDVEQKIKQLQCKHSERAFESLGGWYFKWVCNDCGLEVSLCYDEWLKHGKEYHEMKANEFSRLLMRYCQPKKKESK